MKTIGWNWILHPNFFDYQFDKKHWSNQKICNQQILAITIIFILWRNHAERWRLYRLFFTCFVAHAVEKWLKITHVVCSGKHTGIFPNETTIIEFWMTIYEFAILKISAYGNYEMLICCSPFFLKWLTFFLENFRF